MEVRDSVEIVSENYISYSKYVIETRAYPSIYDGCKAVHRRVIYCCDKFLPKKKVKSVNAIGEIVKLHPHPNSIYGVIVSMASQYNCSFPLFETKGNFGGFGHGAAAERYTECQISDLASKIFTQFVEYADFKVGEMDIDEPLDLPSLLPLCFLHGAYGIPVGMPTVNIPPMNPIDLIKYYLEVLKSRDIETPQSMVVKPNVGNVNIKSTKDEWVEIMRNGQGSIKYGPNITVGDDNKSLIITGVPSKKNFEDVMKVLSVEINQDRVDARDETSTSTRYVVELLPYKRVDINEIKEKLDKKLTVNENFRFIFSDHGVATYCGFHEVVKRNLTYLVKCCENKFKTELEAMEYKLKILETIEEMKSDKSVLKLIEMSTSEALTFISGKYGTTKDQSKTLLSKPLSYLTKEYKNEIIDLKKSIDKNKNNNDDIFQYLTEKYTDLLKDVRKFMKGVEFSKF